jgi:hypothetical protein
MKPKILSLLFLAVIFASAESYTVILKNGKTMQGQLLSETDDLIVFKDEQGLQFSLKKSVLDLEKMKVANETPAASEPVPPPEDIQTSTSSESETAPETPSDPPSIQPSVSQPPMDSATTSSESNPYLVSVREASDKLQKTFEEIGSYLDAMTTAWEVNASTGRDPLSALREFKTTKGSSQIVTIDASFQLLENFKTKLNDPPSQYSSAFDLFNTAIGDLTTYYDSVRQYDGKPAISVFRSRSRTTEQNIQKTIADLKAVK